MTKTHLLRRGLAMLTIIGALCTGGGAKAEQPLVAAITQGKPIIDIRTRFESVDDENCATCKGRTAEAFTARARFGYETGYWNSLQLAFDFDKVWALGAEHYNSTRNGKTLYPTIADPDLITLNRLQLTYASNFNTKFVLGRQRLIFGNQRFIGNSGWRQHEQTFNGLVATNTSIKDLTVSYGYISRVNRIYGPDLPSPTTGQASYFTCRCHLVDAVYVGIPTLRLEAYGHLLDLRQHNVPSTPAYRLSTATYGVRAEEKYPLSSTVTLLLNGEFAHQTDFGRNPLQLKLDYYTAEGGFSYKGFTGLAAYEVLQGNGTIGFSTPLATLHAFNGWADLFLTTPANGLTDLNGKLAYTMKDVWLFKSIVTMARYHVFEAWRGTAEFGTEIDASVEFNVDKNASFLLKYAGFDGAGGAGGFKDKEIFWAQAQWKL